VLFFREENGAHIVGDKSKLKKTGMKKKDRWRKKEDGRALSTLRIFICLPSLPSLHILPHIVIDPSPLSEYRESLRK
jgi:hypothetical protein